ncbi:MAG: DUF1080 domain-containing protein [Planctomycetota bacterium]|nr:MAG: DUF1080 domain-containing protein [Planctomycetota bacterium]
MLIVGKMTLKPCPQTFGETTMIRIFHACLFAASIVTLSLTLSQVHAADDKKPAADKPKPAAKAEDTPPKDAAVDKEGWTSLFNGKDLAGWKVTKFGGEGDIYIEEGAVVISQGSDLSGIHTEQELPKSNYEVQFEAQRAAGSDFFAGLTFPVKDSFCSLIVGGWGGGVCGLSSLSGMDASENETTSYGDFKKGQWYKIRLVVTDDHISAWINDKQIVDVDTTGQRISTRFEVDRSKPFGFATWQTTAKIRNVKLRPLPKTEEKPAEKDASK